MNPFLLTDGYKILHHVMFPVKTTIAYDNFTPRSKKYAPAGCDRVISFGQQYAVKSIHDLFENGFFLRPKDVVCSEIKHELSIYQGSEYDVSHFEALHDLGYLPLRIKAMPEGLFVPFGIPMLTIYNTHPDFGWLPNYLETLLSTLLWKPMTSATIAAAYRKLLTSYATKTNSGALDFVNFQAHDFSMRGMCGVESAILSGMGHAVVLWGSDNIPTIMALREFYDAEGFIIGGVPATEHSVMCAGTQEDEIGTFKRLLDKFPQGILSVVSDTWDLWAVITEFLPALKEQILSRDGKLVIRPDSGDPVAIICGTNSGFRSGLSGEEIAHPSYKGVVELLWDIFGGTINAQGYKVLDSHIGCIYGDSITLERAEAICSRLQDKGFASTNVVLGVGSFTYQYNTRDTFGFAMKATYVEVNGEGRNIFKCPVTDDGTKKSAKGLLCVTEDFKLKTECTWEEENTGMLQVIYEDGQFRNRQTLSQIRERISMELKQQEPVMQVV